MGFPKWQGAVRCTSGPQPGALALAAGIMEEYGDDGAMNWGIFNCRTVRGGSTTSLHGEGRAFDCGFGVGDPDGNHLLGRLLPNVGKLGIQCIIYERRIYSALSPGGRYYSGVNPHYDHLHIELTWDAARRLTKATVLDALNPGLPKHKRGTRDLHEGMEGTDVRWLQRKLEINDDGIFGPRTKARVQRFEENRRKEYPRIKADGWVGPITWVALGVTPKY